MGDSYRGQLSSLPVLFLKVAVVRWQAAQVTEEASRYYRARPSYPANPSKEDLIKLYPDGTLEGANRAYAIDQEILGKLNPSGSNLEEVVLDIFDKMPSTEIAKLPDSFRNKMLMVLDVNASHLHGVADVRFKLNTGYTPQELEELEKPASKEAFDLSRPIGLSKQVIDFLDEKAREVHDTINRLYKENPELEDIARRWITKPESVDLDSKVRLVTLWHNVHAKIYGYPPREIHPADNLSEGQTTFGEYWPSNEKIFYDEGRLEDLDYTGAMTVILHESTHAYADYLMKNYNKLSLRGPQKEIAQLQSIYSTGVLGIPSTYGVDTLVGGTNYILDPREAIAFWNYFMIGDMSAPMGVINDAMREKADKEERQAIGNAGKYGPEQWTIDKGERSEPATVPSTPLKP